MNENTQLTAVVVVTYNRLALLTECIESLRAQTHAANAIIVVDNASTDGTDAWLATQKDLIVLTHDINEGSAGGFYQGMKYAFDNGYHWIWVMDDDVAAEKDCLQKMMEAVKANDMLTVIAPLVEEGGSVVNYHRSNFDIKPELSGFQSLLADYTVPQTIGFASFVGFMISSDLVAVSGLPDKELFFQNDDVEYILRVNKYGKIVLVPEAVIVHKSAKKAIEINKYSLSVLFVKFFVQRNKILIKQKYYRESAPFKAVILRTNVLINYLKNLLKILFIVPFKYKNIYLKVYTQSYMQGLKGKPENKKVLQLLKDEMAKEKASQTT